MMCYKLANWIQTKKKEYFHIIDSGTYLNINDHPPTHAEICSFLCVQYIKSF